MKTEWKLQDAKARFSELVERALSEGPQHVTRRGIPAVVVISEEEFEKVRSRGKRRTLVELFQSCPAPEIFDAIEESRRVPDVGRETEIL
ncbi:MAG: antitoxin Phd [Verrucomicrobiales bacterium]|jgi:antitoxin Phd